MSLRHTATALLMRLVRLDGYHLPRQSAALTVLGAKYRSADPANLLAIASKLIVYAGFSLRLLWWVSPQELLPFLQSLPDGQALGLDYMLFKRSARPELD